jgi:stearoyl-CoA desaturase (delta-9 desaturase)
MNLDFLYGLVPLTFWGYAAVALAMVQFTFMGITLYLHRDATHRSLDLHPALRHVFRFWLWMSSGMVTREWVAVHRKHHARCETPDDPHSPVVYGIKKVLLEGAELYRDAARSPGLVEKYGRGTPDDWLERNLYSRYPSWGIVLMVALDLVLFGVPGINIIAVQMLAVPLMAAGVINGLGHYTGYRNFECPDAARNIVPWALLVAGEELHNNHHAFPSSAKFSIRPWEVDMGWFYIRVLQSLGLAKVLRTAPVPARKISHDHIDLETVRAVIVNRMHVLRGYAKQVTVPVCREQLDRQQGSRFRMVSKLMVRETLLLDAQSKSHLQHVLASNATLDTIYRFRERLSAMWSGANTSNEHLTKHLKEWIAQAEASGITALKDFAIVLRSYSMQPAK